MKQIFLLIPLLFLLHTGVQAQPTSIDSPIHFEDLHLPTSNGDSISLHSLPHKAVIVHFWGTCCKEYKQTLYDYFYEQYDDWHDAGAEIYCVMVTDQPERDLLYLKSKEYPWTNVYCTFDQWREYRDAYGMIDLNYTFLLDGEHKIVRKEIALIYDWVGSGNKEGQIKRFEGALDSLLTD